MALVQTCKCEECGLQKSFANHWVMIVERAGTLVVLPAWDEKKVRRTRHFCGRAHASRFVERWIANPGMALITDVVGEAESNRVTSFSQIDDRTDDRKTEQMLMLDEFGGETSSARIVPNHSQAVNRSEAASLAQGPNRPGPVAASPAMSAVPTPPACVLPPSLSHVAPPSYAREMRTMSY
jgi:hypothetical protein